MKNTVKLFLAALALLMLSTAVIAEDDRSSEVYLTTTTEVDKSIQSIDITWSSMELVYKTIKSGWDSEELEYESVESGWVYTDGTNPNNMITVSSSSNTALDVSLDFAPEDGVNLDGGFYSASDITSDSADNFILASAEQGEKQSKSVFLMMTGEPDKEYEQKTKIGTVTIKISESQTDITNDDANTPVKIDPIPQIAINGSDGNLVYNNMSVNDDGVYYYYEYTPTETISEAFVFLNIDAEEYIIIDTDEESNVVYFPTVDTTKVKSFNFVKGFSYYITLIKYTDGTCIAEVTNQ